MNSMNPTAFLLAGEWSTQSPDIEIPVLDSLIAEGAKINAVTQAAFARYVSPLRVALDNYTASRARLLLQGALTTNVQTDTILHLIRHDADFHSPFPDGNSCFDDLIELCARHYVGGPSFSLPLVRAMVEREPRMLTGAALSRAFERLAAQCLLGGVDFPVGEYLLEQGAAPGDCHLEVFRVARKKYETGVGRL